MSALTMVTFHLSDVVQGLYRSHAGLQGYFSIASAESCLFMLVTPAHFAPI